MIERSKDDRFHSIHVPRPKADCKPLRWDPTRENEHVRVRDYTCDCQDTYYELCQAGGQRFVRRTRRIKGEIIIDECARSHSAKTMAVWSKILSGDAA